MGNKEDWEEVEKWQKDYDSRQKDIYNKTFDTKNIKGVKIFSKIFKIITYFIIGIASAIILAALICAIYYLCSNTSQFIN